MRPLIRAKSSYASLSANTPIRALFPRSLSRQTILVPDSGDQIGDFSTTSSTESTLVGMLKTIDVLRDE